MQSVSSPNSPSGSTRKRNAELLQLSKKLGKLIPNLDSSAKFSGNIEELKSVFQTLDNLAPLDKLEKESFTPYLNYFQQPDIQELIKPVARRLEPEFKAVVKEKTSSDKPFPGATVNPDDSSSAPVVTIPRDVDENHGQASGSDAKKEPTKPMLFSATDVSGVVTVNPGDSSSAPVVTIPRDVDENHGQASGSDAKKEPTKPMLFSALEYLARPFLGALNILWEITGFLIKFFSLGTVDLSAKNNRPKDSNWYACCQRHHPYTNMGHSNPLDSVNTPKP
jgi:hypothetical protein